MEIVSEEEWNAPISEEKLEKLRKRLVEAKENLKKKTYTLEDLRKIGYDV